jgi:chromosome partitioning protein
MTIIVIGNPKGGSGKTTIAVNLAVIAASRGTSVLLIDADPHQHSASHWCARREELDPPPNKIDWDTLVVPDLGTKMRQHALDWPLIIVDTGASDSQELRTACGMADFLVIPVPPEMLDLWTLPTVEAIIEMSRPLNPDLTVVIALSRVPPYRLSTDPDGAHEWMQENTPGLADFQRVPIAGRAAYGHASAAGLGVVEMTRPDLKATTEMERLYDLLVPETSQ